MTLLRLFSALLCFSLVAPASAAVISRITVFEPHIKVTADELNDEFDNIISAINGNISSANIAEGGVSTANIATSAVTNVKLAPVVYATSSSVTFATVNATLATPGSTSPALSATLTLTGKRAVKVLLQSHNDLSTCVPGFNNLGQITVKNFAGGEEARIWGVLYRNATRIAEASVGGFTVASNTANKTFYAPLSGFGFIDTPSSGGSTSYEVKFYSQDTNATMNITCVKAIAVEL